MMMLVFWKLVGVVTAMSMSALCLADAVRPRRAAGFASSRTGALAWAVLYFAISYVMIRWVVDFAPVLP